MCVDLTKPLCMVFHIGNTADQHENKHNDHHLNRRLRRHRADHRRLAPPHRRARGQLTWATAQSPRRCPMHNDPHAPFTARAGYVPGERRPQKGRLTHGVSWPDERVLHFAKSAAHSQNMTLSAYINNLVRREAGMTHALLKAHNKPELSDGRTEDAK